MCSHEAGCALHRPRRLAARLARRARRRRSLEPTEALERLSMKNPVEQLDVKLSSSAGRLLAEPVDKIEQLDSSSTGRFPVELHTCCDSRTTGCNIND